MWVGPKLKGESKFRDKKGLIFVTKIKAQILKVSDQMDRPVGVGRVGDVNLGRL